MTRRGFLGRLLASLATIPVARVIAGPNRIGGLAPPCSVAESVRSGLWSDPGTWKDGLVPWNQSSIALNHIVTLDHDLFDSLITLKPDCYVIYDRVRKPCVAHNIFQCHDRRLDVSAPVVR